MDTNDFLSTLLSEDCLKSIGKAADASEKDVQSVLTTALPTLLTGALGQAEDEKTAEGFGSERAIAAPVGSEGGERVLRTIGNAAVIAKNRYGIPEEIPLDFSIVMNYISKNINSNTQENTTNG